MVPGSLLATITNRPIRGVGELASIAIAKGLSLPDRCRYLFLTWMHSMTSGHIERFDPEFFTKLAGGLDLAHMTDLANFRCVAVLEDAEAAELVGEDCLRVFDAWLLGTALDQRDAQAAPNSAPVLH